MDQPGTGPGPVKGKQEMSKKHVDSFYGEADDEDFILLGSRLYRAIQNPEKPRTRRLRDYAEARRLRENWSRPQPVRIRD